MKRILLSALMMTAMMTMFAQGAKNIRINEVLTDNRQNLQDEYGRHLPWVELANTSYTTYNIRGMYIATNRDVLNKELAAPERIKMMSPIPSGDDRSKMSANDHRVFYLNSNPAQGFLHLTTNVSPGAPIWIALYDGNGVDLIDSVSVPALEADKSFARIKDGNMQWDVKSPEAVTPNTGNYIEVNETKIARLKRDDPHGLGITVLSMAIVFFCLALLYVFFRVFGLLVSNKRSLKKAATTAASVPPVNVVTKTTEMAADVAHKTNVMLKDGLHSKGIDREIYVAVIALAIKQYQDDVHDVESGIITIKPHNTLWNKDNMNNL